MKNHRIDARIRRLQQLDRLYKDYTRHTLTVPSRQEINEFYRDHATPSPAPASPINKPDDEP
jgi:hypothetical protein